MDHPTINDAVRRHAADTPQKLFCRLQTGGTTRAFSYGDLLHRAQRYAALYQRCGLRPGDTVSIVLGLCEDLLAAFVGAQLGGFIPSCLAPPNPRQDADHYWQQLQAQCHRVERGLVLTQPELVAMLAHAAEGSALVLATPDQLTDEVATSGFTAAASDIALLQHSSGTTGSRKGVALSHRAILGQLTRYASSLALDPGSDVIVSWLPLYHDMGLISSFLLPLVSGTPVLLMDPFEWVAAPTQLLDAITRHRGTLVWLPNFAFHFLARVPLPPALHVDLASVRAFVNCSEPCKAEAFEVFLRRFAALGARPGQLQVCYAMAETVFAVTQTPPGRVVEPLQASRQGLHEGRIAAPIDAADALRLMPVGAPLDGAVVGIRDDDGQPLVDGHVGEVCIAAPYLFSGYFREPALSAAALRDGHYLSGDLGAIVDGQLVITGRKKDLLIVNGKNFYAHDVEAALATVDGVKPGRCVAFGIDVAATGSEAVHVVAECQAPAADHAGLVRTIKATVQAQCGLTLARVLIVPGQWLVKTTSGKVSRRDNREKYLLSLQATKATV